MQTTTWEAIYGSFDSSLHFWSLIAHQLLVDPCHWLCAIWSALWPDAPITYKLNGIETHGKPWWLENVGSQKATRQKFNINTGSMIPENMGSHDGFKTWEAMMAVDPKKLLSLLWWMPSAPAMVAWTSSTTFLDIAMALAAVHQNMKWLCFGPEN